MMWIILFSIVSLLILWIIMVNNSRKFYERIRDNADIETEQFLIKGCNQALDEVNSQRIYFYLKWQKIKSWFK